MSSDAYGDPVADPCAAAPDLEYVASPEEIQGCSWHLARIPILEMYAEEELHDRKALPGESPSQAAERWQALRSWIAAQGGPGPAMEACPVIAIEVQSGMVPVDGWHRCVVAWGDYGQQEVNCLIGIPRPEVAEALSP